MRLPETDHGSLMAVAAYIADALRGRSAVAYRTARAAFRLALRVSAPVANLPRSVYRTYRHFRDPPYLPPASPREFPKVRTFAQTIPHLLQAHREQDVLFRKILREYRFLSADPCDPVRIVQFFHLLRAANALPAGDYLELGTYGGLTLKLIHKLMDSTRTLYSLDTFEGFDERDLVVEKTKYDYKPEQEWFSRPSLENVALYVGDGKAPTNLKLVKGWFPDSFKGLEHLRWRLVHIDLDLYQPIKTALETLWEPLLPGGLMLVHDYGCYGFPAARTAVDEFSNSIGTLPIELPDRWGTAVLRKPLAT
jgi:hypothetical protein